MVKRLISILGVQGLIPTHDMGCGEQDVVVMDANAMEFIHLNVHPCT